MFTFTKSRTKWSRYYYPGLDFFFFILKNWTDIEKIGDERSRAEHKEIHQK
jgi:hypothetical protein